MDRRSLLLNDEVVASLRREIREGSSGLSSVPEHLTMLIERDMWRERIVEKTGEVIRFERFEEFIATPPLEGLGADLRTLRNLCRDDDGALTKLTEVTTGGRGGNNNPKGNNQHTKEECKDNDNNINNDHQRTSPVGTSRPYALRKLLKDRPDLYKRVLDDELKPHAAMVEAGFRPKTGTFYPEDIDRTARALLKHFDPDELYGVMKGAKS